MQKLLAWHHLTPQEVILALQSKLSGLTTAEATKRLEEIGQNRLSDKAKSAIWGFLWHQVANPLMLVLGLAVVISFGLGKLADAWLTLAIMIFNLILGFVQEYRADRALRALKQHLPHTVSVRRQDRLFNISATDIVPGDILLLRAGDKVTADARLLKVYDFATNESALTGEAHEVQKSVASLAEETPVSDRANMVFAGSIVVSGQGEAVVVATGKETEFGKVTEMVAQVKDQATPLQQKLLRLSKVLVGVMLLVIAVVYVLGAVRGLPWLEMLSIAAALAVAAVPEGLLVSLTVILTAGMRRMLNRNALVRQLVAAETLGSVNVLCVDKTGTLTTGEMTVAEIRRGTSLLDSEHIQAQDSDVLRILSRVITTRVDGQMTGEPKLIGAPTEVSIMRYLISQSDKFTEEPFQVIDELPFDSARKYSARLLRDQHGEKAIIMGAPDVLLGLADIDDGTMQSYQATLQDMTSRGLRVLLFAEKVLNSSQDLKPDNLKDLQPLGLVGLVDPLRPRATQTIQAAQAAGVRVIMITGDHLGTAAAVATQLGLPTNEDNLLLGRQLAELDNATLQRRLRSVSVFARVLPEHKLRIVQALQSSGYTVAMTGDGVNDAPALRAADIGVAVGSGTEVAKETADVVILDNDVSSIVAAIREGRIIFDNIRKVLVYLLTFSLSEVILLAILLALGLPILLAPIHILWINLVTDGLPSIALAFEKEEPGIMQEPPRDKQAPLIDAGMQKLMTTSAILAIAGMVMTYIFFKAAQLDENTLRSVLFLLLGLDSLMAIFALRNLRRPFWQQPPFTNPSLSFAFIFGGVLLILPLIQPNLIRIFEFANLNVQIWLPLVLLAIFKLMLIELAKFLFLSPVRQATPRLVS